MKSKLFAAALALGSLAALPAHAGPGANMFGCIVVNHQALIGKVAIFEPSPSFEEMSRTGHAGEVLIDGQGRYCASVGYVEAIRGGNLWSSKWTLAYRLVDRKPGSDGTHTDHQTRYSGNITTEWSFATFFGGNKIRKTIGAESTKICLTDSLCTSTEVTWPQGSQGPLYINFDPIKN